MNLSAAQKQLLENLPEAIKNQSKNQHDALLAGVQHYQASTPPKRPNEPAVVWQKGHARLLDYGIEKQTDNPPILIIPSLINRYHILDLTEELSFARWLKAQGQHVLILDWGEPGECERRFNASDYVTDIIVPAITFIIREHGCYPPHLVGYCMGGILAAAAAILMNRSVWSLSLLATPWDFQAGGPGLPALPDDLIEQTEQWLGTLDTVPAQWIQSLFALRQPFALAEKFASFEQKSPEEIAEFMAIERWVNDGVPMTPNLAIDGFINWAGRGQLAAGRWKVKHRLIKPESVSDFIPIFAAIPTQDSIVPTESALAFTQHCHENTTIIHPSTGHIGMMVGSKAKSDMWEPFLQWLHRIA